MTLQVINNGSRANDETAETLFSAFEKVKSNFSELYGIYGSEVEAFTFTTKQDDLAIATGTRIVRWNGAGSTGITGIAAPASARVLTIVNASTDYLLWLENENTASAAANRLMLPDSFPAFLMPGDTITVFYDLTTARWRVLSWPARGQAMGFSLFSDFLDYGQTGGDIAGVNGGTGATQANGFEANAYASGMRKIRTGTTTTGYSSIAGYQAAMYKSAGRGGCVGASVMIPTATDGTDTFSVEVGFSWGDAATATFAAAWEYRWNGSAAELSQTIIDGGTPTRSTTGSPAITTITSRPYHLIVFLNATWTAADFIYSTGGIAYTCAQRVVMAYAGANPRMGATASIKKSAGTTDRAATIDWLGIRPGIGGTR